MVSTSSSRFWVVVFGAPILVNGLLWMVLVTPLQMRLRTLRSAQAVAEIKPALEVLLKESHKILSNSNSPRTGFGEEGDFAVTSALEQLASRHHLQVEVRTKGPQGSSAKGSTIPLEVVVTGHFNKLGRWISDLETQSNLQINSWTLIPGKEPNQPPQLTADITAFL